MANLLPFAVLAMRAVKERWPDRTLVLGGVGSKAVEEQLLERFPWIDVIVRGEAERTGPELLAALRSGGDLAGVAGISFRMSAAPQGKGKVPFSGPQREHGPALNRGPKSGPSPASSTRPTARIRDLDAIPFPAFEKVDLARYAGYGMMTSRGCPYPCTFCSVAPVWNLESYSRSPGSIVNEMEFLHRKAGVELFLFQDEFFVSGKQQVMEFCRELGRRRLAVYWKAFGRVNLVDEEMMRAMAAAGCVELRFGIESGSDRVLREIEKGFTAAESVEVVSKAVPIFRRVDAFFVWGFPFETMEDFHQTLFQMVSFRMLGADSAEPALASAADGNLSRVEREARLEFCPYLLPEFVFTGHEVCRGSRIELPERHREYFDLILANPDIFPGFFHIDLAGNVLPKLELLRQFGFYPAQSRRGRRRVAGPIRRGSNRKSWLRGRISREGKDRSVTPRRRVE